jgi:hypothetical protein
MLTFLNHLAWRGLKCGCLAWGCALLLAWPAAHAQSKRMALVVGNGAYVGEKALANPGNDALDVADALGRAGLTVRLHRDLGRQAMHRAIDGFLREAEGAELALVYYAGHGMQNGGETFLLPVDATVQNERDIRADGLRLSELMDDMETRRIRHSVIILDACRDNPFRSRVRSSLRGLARPREPSGALLVAYATADGMTADDGEGRNGVYSGELLRQLHSRNASSIRDVLEDTQLAVERLTKGRQRPRLYGDTVHFRNVSLAGGLPSAASGAAPAAVGQPVEPVTAQSISESQLWAIATRQNTMEAYLDYLERFPEGEHAREVARRNFAFANPAGHPVGNCKIATSEVQKISVHYVWRGSCLAGRAEGQGMVEVTRPDGGKVHHKGQFRRGMREGVWREEFVTKGANRPDGPALVWRERKYVMGVPATDWESMELDNGATYSGSVRHDGTKIMRHGQGVARFVDGGRYEGAWQNDKQHGWGIFRAPNGFSYEGEHVAGVATGQGRIRYSDGGTYSGAMLNGKRHGFGELISPTGQVSRGRFANNDYLGP